MVPPTFTKCLIRTGVCATTTAAAIVALTVMAGTPWNPLVAGTLGLGAVLVPLFAVRGLRDALADARSRLAASPAGLCPRCEHPLREGEEPFVTCTECGLNRERGEVDRDWNRWVELPL